MHVIKLCNNLMMTQCKITKKSLFIKMLKQCSLKFLLSKWILFRIRNSKLKISSKVENMFLKCEFSKVEKSVKYLNYIAELLTNELESKINSEDFKNILNI